MRAPALLRPLGSGRFALLVAGLSLSAIGDQFFLVVLTWVAAELFGSAAGYLVSLKAAVVLVVALGAGGVFDRLPRRVAMAGADLVRAAVLLMASGAWLVAGSASGWLLIVCVTVLAAGEAAFRPALRASVPWLTARETLPAANALVDSAERIARLTGPALVAVLVGLVPVVHFLTVDAATFVVSALCVLWAVRGGQGDADGTRAGRRSALTEAARGFRAVARDRVLLAALAMSGPANGAWFGALFVALPLLLAEGRSEAAGLSAFGTVIACYGATNLVSMLIVGSRRIVRAERLIFPGEALVGVGVALMGGLSMLTAGAGWWQVAAMSAAAGFAAPGGPMSDIPTATRLQTVLRPDEVAAAVRAFMVAANAGMLIGLAAIPAVIGAIGPAATIFWCGVVVALVGVLGMAATFGHEAVRARA